MKACLIWLVYANNHASCSARFRLFSLLNRVVSLGVLYLNRNLNCVAQLYRRNAQQISDNDFTMVVDAWRSV
jgi:hypothetical protein